MKKPFWVVGCGLLGILISSFTYAPISFALSGKRHDFRHQTVQVPVEFETEVDSRHDPRPSQNAPFSIVTTQDIPYPQFVIPSGTRLCGVITRIRASKRFGQPAYAKVRFDHVILPDGTILSLDAASGCHRADLVIEPDRHRNLTHFIIENILLENASILVTGPLALTEHMSVAMFNLVDTVSGIAIGVGYGLMESHRHPAESAKVLVDAPSQNAADGKDADPSAERLNLNLIPQSLTSVNRIHIAGSDPGNVESSGGRQAQMSQPKRLRHIIGGVYESLSPIPPFWQLATKAKDIHYEPGDMTNLAFTRSGLRRLQPLFIRQQTAFAAPSGQTAP